ncbi:MAG: MoxR family ATPase [Eubacteriales bacterium]|nr:MoxR family ATPase [Eubacteriales bacterium]
MDIEDNSMQKAKLVFQEVCKTVVGKDEIVLKILMAILANGHVLVEDIPGVGKTTMALSFANALGLNCNRVQFTPDVMPSDVTGFNMYNKMTNKFEYKPGAVMCNIMLADEINRTSPKTQSALLQVMEERCVTVDGATYELPDPFIVMATQNPFGSVGTQRLPESQMDRFMVCLSLGYPTIEDEIAILRGKQLNNNKRILSKKVLMPGELEKMRRTVSDVYVDDSIFEYVARIAKATRESEDILQGISPRGSIAVIAMAKAEAFLRGNSYVLPADIQYVLKDTIAHRMVFDHSLRKSSLSEEKVIAGIVRKVPVPQIAKKEKAV